MIEIKNVSFKYGSNSKINNITDINLKIKQGEFVVLTGASGCGKTTVTRLINGLIPNYYEGELKGNILIKGKDITKLPIHDTANVVGSVFQNPRSQFFNVDTLSELAFAPENQGIEVKEIEKRIESTVDNFNIEKLMGRSLFKLSGGEKQKIACASVSVAGSDVIVLDEPSSNLDAEGTNDLKKVLKMWKTQRKTIIISEHRLYYLRELIDKMIIMKNGRIAEEIKSSELKTFNLERLRKIGLRPLQIEELQLQNNLNKSSNESVKLSNFNFTYKESKNGINISELIVKDSSIIAVIGHNGAGKSTFARCLCGLEKSCRGVLIQNNNKFNSKDRLKKCYMVMQDVNHQLFTESVLDEVLLSMSDKKMMSEEEKNKVANEILNNLDLEEYVENHPMSLSGGQKQRVAIASAIAADRNIIIFDEPTSGLDYKHMSQVAQMLKKLSEDGKTIFVITHDLELILNSCSHVLRLENGKAVEMYEINKESEGRIKHFFIKNSY